MMELRGEVGLTDVSCHSSKQLLSALLCSLSLYTSNNDAPWASQLPAQSVKYRGAYDKTRRERAMKRTFSANKIIPAHVPKHGYAFKLTRRTTSVQMIALLD